MTRYVQNTDVIATQVGDSTVLLNTRSGAIIELDAPGGFVWTHLSAPTSVAALAELAAGNFADAANAHDHIDTFVNELLRQQMVRHAD